jgi:glucokinase
VEWRRLPAWETLGAVAPVIFEADVRAAALAEARLGAGQSSPIFLDVTFGAGSSCCLMLEGRPHLGTHGLTGTMASSPPGAPCERCGHTSGRSLEAFASGPGLVARYRAAGGEAKDGSAVLAATAAGNEAARRIVQSASDALGSPVALWVNTLGPGAVVVGGGLGVSEGLYWEHFREAARRHIRSPLNRG